MIRDLFDGVKCRCGYLYRYGDRELKFKRLYPIKRKSGIDYRCRCNNCKREFNLKYIREPKRKWKM